MAGAWGAGAPDSRRRWNPTRHVAQGPRITLPAPQVPPPENSDHRASGLDTRISEVSPKLHLVPRSARTALVGSAPSFTPRDAGRVGLCTAPASSSLKTPDDSTLCHFLDFLYI